MKLVVDGMQEFDDDASRFVCWTGKDCLGGVVSGLIYELQE